MMKLIFPLVLVFTSALITRLFYTLAQNTRLVDKVNERSLHTQPTVRGGGCVFIGLSLLLLPFIGYFNHFPLQHTLVLVLAILLLASVSFLDDLYQLSVKGRFIVQSLAALFLILFIKPESLNFIFISIHSPLVIALFLFFSLLWAINHFNFMDGLDGFCALQAIFLFAAYGLIFELYQAPVYAAFCYLFLFNLIGFLFFNFPPAKLFMGDVGSATLGFTLFALAIVGQALYQIPLAYWFILNGLFLFDASITLFRRFINKERCSSAHRKHAYQRLKLSGLPTKLILLGQVMLNLFLLALVLLIANKHMSISLVLALALSLLLTLYFLIEKRLPMYSHSV